MTVGEKIRKFRIDQGYTQKELAIMSGLSESAIRNYELGNRFPSSEQLEKIANSLKISPVTFLYEILRKGKRKHYIISCINTQSAFVSCMYKYRICTYGIGQNPNTQQYGYRTLFCIWTV